MTEQELREKIEQVLVENQLSHSIRGGKAVFILAQSPKKIVARILALIKEAGCVQLAEDQNLPSIPFSIATMGIEFGYIEGQQDLLKAGWRKVELDIKETTENQSKPKEEKDG